MDRDMLARLLLACPMIHFGKNYHDGTSAGFIAVSRRVADWILERAQVERSAAGRSPVTD